MVRGQFWFVFERVVVDLGFNFRAFHLEFNLLQRLVYSKLFWVDSGTIWVQICFVFERFAVDVGSMFMHSTFN